MLPKVKQKLQQQHQQTLLQKDDIKCRELIGNFKKSIELWFINGADDDITFGEIQDTCIEIIMHGMQDPAEMFLQQQINNKNANAINDSSPTTSTSDATSSYGDPDLYALIKRFDDFEWILNAVNIRSFTKGTKRMSVATTPPPASFLSVDGISATSSTPHTKLRMQSLSLQQQPSVHRKAALLKSWLKENLHQSILGAFIQYLVSDKEMLEEHYTSEALLKQEKYTNALVIGLSALETHQYGLLTQIDVLLKEGGDKETRHKRSNSQPNVIVLPVTRKTNVKVSSPQRSSTTVLSTIRKTKSLIDFRRDNKDSNDVLDARSRPRCKTMAGMKRKQTNPQNIPRVEYEKTCNFTAASVSSSYDDDQKPSTSQNSTSNRNKSPMSSLHLNSTASLTSGSTSSTLSSFTSNTTARRIHLINTDDIKIWTDHTWESKNKTASNSLHSTPAQVIPKPHCLTTTASSSSLTHKASKSVSPLNSFFSSFFSTPPSYTSWYTDHSSQDDDQLPETAIDSIKSDNKYSHNYTPVLQSTPPTLSSTVFDKFLPIYGKKLRTRNSQNLFDDVSTALDYSTPVALHCNSSSKDGSSPSPTNSSGAVKNCQSLTRFLQMSHLSRNNTELEKENAHFRVSEAIISAIEHIKWNKQEPRIDQHSSREATPLATDCLSSSSDHISTKNEPTIKNDCIEVSEHVPYAEEVCLDLLSAEVVGLSLISKFDEKQLPKVSELKWLVSDDDTPQNLLPLPDLTSSANPDEHVMHSVTRGTKYWAPPRQQIIFTDHPTPNRKELLKKQNFRCAGCGMRVSPQYVHSFRYCTYLGKLHCTGCHRNQISATPAKILQMWDFKCYPVSVFAYRLLEQMSSYPLFYVPDLNPALYFHSKSLLSARNKRLQLKFVKDFIRTCRFAVREQTYFESVPEYISSDIDNWSMSDFIDTRSKCLHRSIDELISKCENHIFNCVLCTARGFLCELCHADSVIYPWDSRVHRCDRCGSCYHRNCWKSISGLCCRCQRIDKRQEEDEIHDV